MERAVLVYTTWPSIVEAERAGRTIVERRLGSCVNILPGMIVKTRASLAEQVGATVKELHSYQTPAIMFLPVENVDPDYHRWIVQETAEAKAP